MKLAAYIPDCNDPVVQQQIKDGLLPANLCTYPPEVIEAICERQPWLCQPSTAGAQPSIWEPIFGTAEDVGKRILRTEAAVGVGMLRTLDIASLLVTMLPVILIGAGVYYLVKK